MNETSSLGFVMVDLGGTHLMESEAELLRHPACGGLVLFTRNYASPSQLKELIVNVRTTAGKPLLVAVDHEGGRVQRFREHFTILPPMAWLGTLYDLDPQRALTAARELAWLMAAELRSFDIDLSFAPVLDLAHGICAVIGDRALHADPNTVTHLGKAWIQGMHEAGMAATGKHFPGHGGVAEDSHLALPVDHRSMCEIEACDLKPFAQLIQQGLDAIMPAHVVYEQVDACAASFSPVWLQQILRHRLKFEGVIFSDDLAMVGATQAGSYSERAKAALAAGCDILVVCNQPQAAREILDAVPLPRPAKSLQRLTALLLSSSNPDMLATRRQQAICLAAQGLTWSRTKQVVQS